jgi:high-affinity Fe2+/Pb2+ permease
MGAIILITFREVLEMILVGGAVYAALIEHKIPKKRELFSGFITGFIVSCLIVSLVIFFGSQVHFDIHELGEIVEGLNYIGTGAFLFLTAILLHRKMKHILSLTSGSLLSTSIYAIGFFTVFREGVEIAFFSFSSSFLSSLQSLFGGFILGLLLAIIVGFYSFKLAYTKVSHTTLLTITDWAIKILSVIYITKGLLELAEFVF